MKTIMRLMLAMGLYGLSAMNLQAQAVINSPQINPDMPNSEMYVNDVKLDNNPIAMQTMPGMSHRPVMDSKWQVSAMAALIDSIYNWTWNVDKAGWETQAYSKEVGMTYDAQNNRVSYYTELWNNNNWQMSLRYLKTYDERNNISSITIQDWYGTWRSRDIYIYSYDENNNLQSIDYMMWIGWRLFNVNKETFTYNSGNKMTGDLYENWNGMNWVKDKLYTMTYNANGYVTNELYQTWNGTGWVNVDINKYSYDANNNKTGDLYQIWKGTGWYNSAWYLYTYNIRNNNTGGLVLNWNGSEWINSTKYTATYRINNLITSKLSQNWSGAGWVNNTNDAYFYNSGNQLTGVTELLWVQSAWVLHYRNGYTYDENNQEQSYYYKYFENSGTKVVNGDSTYIYFITKTAINNISPENEINSIYPNPSNGTFTISFKNYAAGIRNMEVYNVLGEKIYSNLLPVNNSQFTIELKQPNGIYFYRIVERGGSITGEGKLIIQK